MSRRRRKDNKKTRKGNEEIVISSRGAGKKNEGRINKGGNGRFLGNGPSGRVCLSVCLLACLLVLLPRIHGNGSVAEVDFFVCVRIRQNTLEIQSGGRGIESDEVILG